MTHPKVHSKIEEKLDILERMMKQGIHLKSVDTINEILADLGKYRPYMNDEQSDFIDGCRVAKDEQMEWK